MWVIIASNIPEKQKPQPSLMGDFIILAQL